MLSPELTTITATGSAQFRVQLFQGKRKLRDVTSETDLSMERQRNGRCDSSVQIFDSPYCDRLFSCDQSTLACTGISPGEWLLRAHGRFDGRGLHSNLASLIIKPKENLTITPDHFEPTIYGLDAEQQLEVSGARGPVTWEAELPGESGGGAYVEPLPVGGNVVDRPNLNFNRQHRYFVLDPSTGILSGTRGHEPPPWSARLRVRAWDPAGNSGEREYDVSSTAPPSCATACAFTGANLSMGVAWKDEPGCDYSFRAYENGVPWPYYENIYPTKDYDNGTFAPGNYFTFNRPEGRQNWMLDYEGPGGNGMFSSSPKARSPGETIAIEVGCWVEKEPGVSELVSSAISNTVVLKQ